MIIIASSPILIFTCALFKCTNTILVYDVKRHFQQHLVISWRSVLLVGKLEYPVETINLSQVIDKLYHIMLNRVHLAINGVRIPSLSGDMH